MDHFGERRARGLEAGGTDQHVKLKTLAARADGGVALDPLQGRSFEPDVVARQRREVVIGDQYTFAADFVIGRERHAQLGVCDLAVQMRQRHFLGLTHETRDVATLGKVALAGPEQVGPQLVHQRRDTCKQALLSLGVAAVGTRDHVGRAALEHYQLAGQLGHLRHDLDGRCTRAHHADAFALQRHIVLPARRMEDVASKAGQAFDLRQVLIRQVSRAGDQHPAGEQTL